MASARSVDDEHELAARMASLAHGMRIGGLLERRSLRDRRPLRSATSESRRHEHFGGAGGIGGRGVDQDAVLVRGRVIRLLSGRFDVV
jgi:hypothetical protein